MSSDRSPAYQPAEPGRTHSPDDVPVGWVEANALFANALRYISSPTMGLPGGRDALDFVDEASEQNVRLALKACIRTARQALAQGGSS